MEFSLHTDWQLGWKLDNILDSMRIWNVHAIWSRNWKEICPTEIPRKLQKDRHTNPHMEGKYTE